MQMKNSTGTHLKGSAPVTAAGGTAPATAAGGTAPAKAAGFTLAEMMVVIVILGLLATLVVPNVIQKLGMAMGGKVKSDIVAIESALDEFAIQNGNKYPDTLESLVTPDVNGNTYLRGMTKVPLDPWKNEYGYEPPHPPQQARPRVFSLGKDGQPGGEGDNADIDNDSIRNEEKK